MPLDPADAARLRDVVAFGEKVADIVAGADRDRFLVDAKTLFAACYGIQVVGEAAWKLSESFKKAHPTIPWPMISSMRHRLVHDYGRTDEAIIHQVATVHLPLLVQQIRDILARET
jgi:uncharacterized protein with HEPN domain